MRHGPTGLPVYWVTVHHGSNCDVLVCSVDRLGQPFSPSSSMLDMAARVACDGEGTGEVIQVATPGYGVAPRVSTPG
jgi:hypothetical protein